MVSRQHYNKPTTESATTSTDLEKAVRHAHPSIGLRSGAEGVSSGSSKPISLYSLRQPCSSFDSIPFGLNYNSSAVISAKKCSLRATHQKDSSLVNISSTFLNPTVFGARCTSRCNSEETESPARASSTSSKNASLLLKTLALSDDDSINPRYRNYYDTTSEHVACSTSGRHSIESVETAPNMYQNQEGPTNGAYKQANILPSVLLPKTGLGISPFYGMCISTTYGGPVTHSGSNEVCLPWVFSDGFIDNRPNEISEEIWNRRHVPLPSDKLWIVHSISTHHARMLHLLVRVRQDASNHEALIRREDESVRHETYRHHCIRLPSLPSNFQHYEPDVIVLSQRTFHMMSFESSGLFLVHFFNRSNAFSNSILLGHSIPRNIPPLFIADGKEIVSEVAGKDLCRRHHHETAAPPSTNSRNECPMRNKINEEETVEVPEAMTLDGEIISWSPRSYVWPSISLEKNYGNKCTAISL